MPKAPTRKRRADGTPEHRSWTQCSTYFDCPFLYKTKYVDGKKPERNYPMMLGSAMHVAARLLNVKAQSDKQEISAEDVRTIFTGAVRSEMGRGVIRPTDWQGGIDSLTNYAWTLHRNIENMHGAELEVDIPYGDKGLTLKVIIDRLDYLEGGGVKIIDYKNGLKILSKEELAEDKQLAIYAYAATQMIPNVERIVVAQYMFRYQFENALEIPVDGVGYIKEWLDEALAGIEAKEFPARVNRNCPQCPIRSGCKEYETRFVVHHEDIVDVQKAHEELKKVKASTDMLTARSKVLKEYIGGLADTERQVVVDGGKLSYRFREEEKHEFPTDKVIALFKKYKRDITGALSVSAGVFEAQKKELFAELTQEKIDAFKAEAGAVVSTKKQTKLIIGKPLPEETESEEKA